MTKSVCDMFSHMKRTVLQALIELRIGRSLRQYVFEARAAGATWKDIAEAISTESGQTVHTATVRNWFSDEADAVVNDALRDAALKAAS